MAYLLFSGSVYYPEGGADDLKGKFATVEDAIAAHDNGEWANILCLDSLKIVMSFYRGQWSSPDEDAEKAED